MSIDMEARDTTYKERATFGTCTVCGAQQGEWCFPEIGFSLGYRIGGGKPLQGEGAHLARLQSAPKRVQLIAVR